MQPTALHSIQTGVVNHGACKQLCLIQPSCQAYVFTENDPTAVNDNECSLKSDYGTPTSSATGSKVGKRECEFITHTFSKGKGAKIRDVSGIPNRASCRALCTSVECEQVTYVFGGTHAGRCDLRSSYFERVAKSGVLSGPKYCWP